MRFFYGATVDAIDFSDLVEEAVDRMDSMVEEKTGRGNFTGHAAHHISEMLMDPPMVAVGANLFQVSCTRKYFDI